MITVILFCYTINDWEPRLVRQLNRIKNSGLYEAAEELHLVITDINNENVSIISHLIDLFPKYNLHYHNRNLYEYHAINLLDNICRNDEDRKVLYLHTKGVFNKYKNFLEYKIDDLKTSGCDSWVETLEFFLVDNWENCVNKLDEYDTVGVSNNDGWWWGNFWWTKSSHVRKNVPMKDWYSGQRWSCEAWLHEATSNPTDIKYFEFFRFNYDPAYSKIPKYFYDGTDISNIEINIVDATFGYFSEQRDECRPLHVNEDLLIDITHEISESVKSAGNKRIFNDWQKFPFESKFLNKFGQTNWSSLPKTVRIKFYTNLDPENIYVVSSFKYHTLNVGYLD